MSNNRIRLVVVDDHSLFRRGLVSLLADMADFEVVGEATNGVDAIEIIRLNKPDVVLMDVNMPQMDGITAVQGLRNASVPVKILMLTISQENEDLIGAIQAGADGYLLKNTEPDELRRSILRDAKADLLVFGMGERAAWEIAERLRSGRAAEPVHQKILARKGVKLQIHRPTSDQADAAFLAANPGFMGVSIKVTGTFNGTPFTFTTDLTTEIEMALNKPIEVKTAICASHFR